MATVPVQRDCASSAPVSALLLKSPRVPVHIQGVAHERKAPKPDTEDGRLNEESSVSRVVELCDTFR
jgi:hypothetical protein